MRENNELYWRVDRSCPLHSAQPCGAKVPAMSRISPTNGSSPVPAPARRDDPPTSSAPAARPTARAKKFLRPGSAGAGAAGGGEASVMRRRGGIVPRVDTRSLRGREDALGGDAVVDRQVGLHVVVRLVPAGRADRPGPQGRVRARP